MTKPKKATNKTAAKHKKHKKPTNGAALHAKTSKAKASKAKMSEASSAAPAAASVKMPMLDFRQFTAAYKKAYQEGKTLAQFAVENGLSAVSARARVYRYNKAGAHLPLMARAVHRVDVAAINEILDS